MLLAIDIGNSNIVLGVFHGEVLTEHWRIATRIDYTADELGVILRGLFGGTRLRLEEVQHMVVSSVVPSLNQAIADLAQRQLGIEPLVIGPGVRTGMQIRYDNPREVGADRIVNSVAAFTKYGGPAVVIDFGTATTFDAVGKNGDYLGGVIAPGIRISMDALFSRAAKLPRFELAVPPGLEGVIGKNTVESMQAGFVFGFAGQIEGIVGRMREELGGECRVIATGGLAALIAAHAQVIQVVDDNLTLDGLRLLHDLNTSR
ncbi:MAG TPA: type III pantothenate kinase [Candidatus Dormibacteraeota bacterium]|nr:type III pantothenate kinase [Candidatus Dormibacteraeota bacterium]